MKRLAVRLTRRANQNVYRTQYTGNHAQNLINSVGRCSSEGRAVVETAEKFCCRNSNGEYCGAINSDTASIVNAYLICFSSYSSYAAEILPNCLGRIFVLRTPLATLKNRWVSRRQKRHVAATPSESYIHSPGMHPNYHTF